MTAHYITDAEPSCDICGEHMACSRGDACPTHGGDWNGETGNHRSCERTPADTLSGRAIRPADCDHDDECDCELISLCPACGQPIDYCPGHGEIGDPEGWAVLNAHDHDRHGRCHPDGCDYLHEHEAGRHSLCGCDYRHEHEAGRHGLCRPAWCASVLSFEDAAASRNSRAYLETMTAEQTLEALRLLIAERGHTPQVARLAGDVAREWLQAHPEYVEEMA